MNNDTITQDGTSINYFGKIFQTPDWKSIPGNNGIVNPWLDEESIRKKYWNSFKPGEVVIDIGACFGLYALPALTQGCRVISAEPNRKFLDIIQTSVNMNKEFIDNYIGCEFAFWNDSEYTKELKDPVLKWCNKKSLNITTLDKFTQNLDRLDMIKIDTEGAELAIICGAKNTIRKYKPTFLIEDHTGIYDYCTKNNSREIIKIILKEAGYNVELELFGSEPPAGRYFIYAKHKGRL